MAFAPYVLITSARNEEDYIEKTIASVVHQTVVPEKWIIVSDGSTDRTDEIVRQYSTRFHFIELMRRDTRGERSYQSQKEARTDAVKRLENTPYEFIGCLDADLSFGPDYYERLMEHFRDNPRLGIAGGQLTDCCNNKKYRDFSSRTSVPGGVQFFRRNCYEEIGGFTPLAYGKVDAVAEITARMKGWETRSFPELTVLHYRRVGTEGKSIWKTRFHEGKAEYLIGYHPLFHLARAFQRLVQKPYILGSVIRTGGFFWACLREPKRDVTEDFVRFVQAEEMHKLRALFKFNH
jgi:glycosyltransferase involved in cell wall biosynthesis